MTPSTAAGFLSRFGTVQVQQSRLFPYDMIRWIHVPSRKVAGYITIEGEVVAFASCDPVSDNFVPGNDPGRNRLLERCPSVPDAVGQALSSSRCGTTYLNDIVYELRVQRSYVWDDAGDTEELLREYRITYDCELRRSGFLFTQKDALVVAGCHELLGMLPAVFEEEAAMKMLCDWATDNSEVFLKALHDFAK